MRRLLLFLQTAKRFLLHGILYIKFYIYSPYLCRHRSEFLCSSEPLQQRHTASRRVLNSLSAIDLNQHFQHRLPLNRFHVAIFKGQRQLPVNFPLQTLVLLGCPWWLNWRSLLVPRLLLMCWLDHVLVMKGSAITVDWMFHFSNSKGARIKCYWHVNWRKMWLRPCWMQIKWPHHVSCRYARIEFAVTKA